MEEEEKQRGMNASRQRSMMMAGRQRETGLGVQFLSSPRSRSPALGSHAPRSTRTGPGAPTPPASPPCACLSPACLLVRFQLTPISDPAAQCRANPPLARGSRVLSELLAGRCALAAESYGARNQLLLLTLQSCNHSHPAWVKPACG
jgi:hypothetical protein